MSVHFTFPALLAATALAACGPAAMPAHLPAHSAASAGAPSSMLPTLGSSFDDDVAPLDTPPAHGGHDHHGAHAGHGHGGHGHAH